MFKLFRKKNYSTKKEFKVLIIDENASEITDVLGISSQRKNELVDICKIADNKHRKLSNIIEDVYKNCKHENEIAYATLLIGRLHDRNEGSIGSALIKLLGDL
jgi:hypothetical protein